MKLKYAPVLAFAAFTAVASHSNAGGFRSFANIFRDCKWDNSDPYERAQTDYERLTTTPPVNANYKLSPFQESDFNTKPWLRSFEYVIVINNSNSIVQNEVMPRGLPIDLPQISQLGIIDRNSVEAINNFKVLYGPLADQVYSFGAVKYGPDRKTPLPSGIEGAQTIRIYRRGQLLRVAKVSTGRNQFEVRGQNPSCKTRPAQSYYSITEPGYFTFQELVKSGYKSASYDDADMPNAMFYMRNRGIALHEEPEDALIPLLGRRASGGCTRLDPDTATNLFDRIFATQGTQIPVINRDGTPAVNANGQVAMKTEETITYYEGTSRQYQVKRPTYSALLIVQPDTVKSSQPQVDQSVSFKFKRTVFTSQGPAPM